MQRLNAIDAIAPAFTRTHELLFKPFRIGRSWKLAATSHVAFFGSFFFPFPLIWGVAAYWAPGARATILPFVMGFSLIGTLVYLAVFYCLVRLQLVDFEMVVTSSKVIAPMWRKYGIKTWPWLAAKVLIGLVSLAIMVPILFSAGKGLYSGLALIGPHPDSETVSQMMASFFGFYFLALLLFLIPKTLATLLDDFVLPFFLIQDLPFFVSLQRGFTVFAADPLNCIGYLVLKLILAVIGYIMQTLAVQVCMIPVVLIAALAFGIGAFLVHHAGPVGTLVAIASGIVLGLAFIAVVLYASIGVFGYLLLLLDSYAIYFLGGRYPQLGNLLEPGPGGPFTPPPVYPSPEEDNDSDSGPPMPMNPAVA